MAEETKPQNVLDDAPPAADPDPRGRWLDAMADMESRFDLRHEQLRARVAKLEGRGRRGWNLTEEEKTVLVLVGAYLFVSVLVPVVTDLVRRWAQRSE